jgi:hypothetical protein
VPPAAPVPGVLATRIAWSGVGPEQPKNTLYWSYSSGPAQAADLVAFANAVGSAFHTAFQSFININVTMSGVLAIDLSSSSGQEGQGTTGSAGADSGAQLPAEVCAVINYRILRHYRGGHPRGYWPFGSIGNLADSAHWATTWVTALATAFAGFVTAVEALSEATIASPKHVAISRYAGSTWSSGPPYKRIPTPRSSPLVEAVAGYSVSSTLGSQRKRYGR